MTDSPRDASSTRIESAYRAVCAELQDAERTAPNGAVEAPLHWIDRFRALLAFDAGGTGGSRPGGYTLARQFAHDAGSPVSALVVVAGSLRKRLDPLLGEEDIHQLKLLESTTVALHLLLRDVVALTGPDDELVSPRRQPFSMAELLHRVRDATAPLAQVHGFEIQVRGTDPDRRSGYPTALSQTLLALAAIPLRSGRPRSLEITADPLPEEPARVNFTIRSAGPAQDPETVARVEAVSVGRAARDRTSLSHLGLELAFRLVRAMGSTLSVDGGDPSGTQFTFTLDLPPPEPKP